jgi:hypothetical protein
MSPESIIMMVQSLLFIVVIIITINSRKNDREDSVILKLVQDLANHKIDNILSHSELIKDLNKIHLDITKEMYGHTTDIAVIKKNCENSVYECKKEK